MVKFLELGRNCLEMEVIFREKRDHLQMEGILKPAQATAQKNDHLAHPLDIDAAPITKKKTLFIDDDDSLISPLMIDRGNGVGESHPHELFLIHQVITREIQDCAELWQVSEYSGAKD